ncbi:Uncharacterised protein [Mycobacteroides abscessus subsp. massiliense]|uniref:hypothetical protein n=1 Tax=Mycobacteroides abscessus TaxID=36809 RepID=UPI0009A89BAA|nr:hypothetical protein [Mycobacteroides abscessus]SKU88762.1 Uncharacterised protein [Mycobacteroides abscessus subsp. massiliense]SKU96806.1 Uncharacterised protein [Mycobacteroides abscessus subsp. massiliense]SKY03259.1 Uncharacterised protein [Mycobacteroides abscessus subsp. massiliense]SKZ07842.1 Uncharacterised protein [Mycobacteroides abscessus subsp. massiliense]
MRAPDITLNRQDGTPYLLRWHVIPRNKRFNIYLHKFLGSDDDRALHDHPWWFVSILLKGSYWEHRADGSRNLRKAPSIAFRRATVAHRVELVPLPIWSFEHDRWYEKPATTLIITGRVTRDWGFHCPNGWKHWRKFINHNGCGEK